LPASYRKRLHGFRYGPGVYKMDWALLAPLPWQDPACARAATVHLAGGAPDVAAAEAAVHARRLPERPFVLVVQPSLFDATRAPPGRHTLWAYCHVPHASPVDASPAIEAQIDRFAAGWRDLVLARSARNALEVERHNPTTSAATSTAARRTLGSSSSARCSRPTRTPRRRGASSCARRRRPRVAASHGMCGFRAARSVLLGVFGQRDATLGAQRT
jgi:phytoene dehydrogenase-like protein